MWHVLYFRLVVMYLHTSRTSRYSSRCRRKLLGTDRVEFLSSYQTRIPVTLASQLEYIRAGSDLL